MREGDWGSYNRPELLVAVGEMERKLAAKDEEIARLLQKVLHLDAALYLERTGQRIKHAKQEAAHALPTGR